MKQAVYFSNEEKKDRSIPLCIIVLAGMLIGSFAARYAENFEFLMKFMCPELYSDSAREIFLLTLETLGMFLITSFFMGFSAVAQPLGFILLVGIGAELGCSAAMMYSEKGAAAIPAVLVLFLPKAVAVSAVAVISIRELLRNSSALLLSMTGQSEPPQLRLYCIRYVVLAAAVLLIAALSAIINYFFRGLI